MVYGGKGGGGGGATSAPLGDVWRFDTVTREWSELPTTGAAPAPAPCCAAAVAGRRLAVLSVRQCKLDPGLKAPPPVFKKFNPNEEKFYFQT